MSTTIIEKHRKPLSVEEAAEYLDVPPPFLWRLVAEGRIRHLKLGKYCRIDLRVLDEYRENCLNPVGGC